MPTNTSQRHRIERQKDCVTNLRFADDLLLFSTSLHKVDEVLCEFKRSTDRQSASRYTRVKLRSSATEQDEEERSHEKLHQDSSTKKRQFAISWTKITFEEQETKEIKKQIESVMGSVPQIPTRVHLLKHIAYGTDCACSTW